MKTKRILAAFLVGVLGVSTLGGVQTVKAETLPEKAFYWDFESVEGTDAGDGATLKAGAKIEEDFVRGKVLTLPGGASGEGGSLVLPSLFENVGDDGFTLAMWVKIFPWAGDYQRIFAASNNPLGVPTEQSCGWSLPEIGFVTGGSYHTTLYAGEPMTSSQGIRFSHTDYIEKDQWTYVTISVTPNSYSFYIDGIKQSNGVEEEESITAILKPLFADGKIKGYKYASIGQSIYLSDGDFTGQVDSVSFYNTALTVEQVDTLAVSEGVSVDKTELQSLYNAHINTDASQYTTATYNTLQAALTHANVVLDSESTTLNQIHDATVQLETAVNGLKVRGSQSELQTEYDKYTGYNESDYTKASWQPFGKALAYAEELLAAAPETVSKEEVDAAIAELQRTVLKLYTTTDKNALQEEYDKHAGLDEDSYTGSSWEAFVVAYNDAKKALADIYSTQEEIDTALRNLQEKAAALVKIDKTALETAYETYYETYESDGSQYNEEKWNRFVAAVEAAEATLDNADASQETIDAALAELNASYTDVTTPTFSFEDVVKDDPQCAWFYNEVMAVCEKGYMKGYTEDAFAPLLNVTRAEFATMLYRLAGSPEVTGENPFSDVPAGYYFDVPTLWANQQGIILGETADRFAPDKQITREDMVTILYRYLGDSTTAEADFSIYPDGNKVSYYAVDAMKWALEHEIVRGNADGTLKPQGKATRAEAAIILNRFDELIK